MQRRAADSNRYTYSYVRFFRYNRISLKKLLVIKRISPKTRILPIIRDIVKWRMFTHHLLVSWCYREYRKMFKKEKKIDIVLDGKESREYRLEEFMLKQYLWVKRVIIGRNS